MANFLLTTTAHKAQITTISHVPKKKKKLQLHPTFTENQLVYDRSKKFSVFHSKLILIFARLGFNLPVGHVNSELTFRQRNTMSFNESKDGDSAWNPCRCFHR